MFSSPPYRLNILNRRIPILTATSRHHIPSASEVIVIRVIRLPLSTILLWHRASRHLDALQAMRIMIWWRPSLCPHLLMEILQVCCFIILSIIFLIFVVAAGHSILGQPRWVILVVVLLNLPLAVLAHRDVLAVRVLHLLIRLLSIHVQVVITGVNFTVA